MRTPGITVEDLCLRHKHWKLDIKSEDGDGCCTSLFFLFCWEMWRHTYWWCHVM